MARLARTGATAAGKADGGGSLNAARRDLGLVVAGALLLRLVLLVARGDYVVYDEGYYLLLARSLRQGHGFLLNGLPHVALSPLQPVLVAALSLVGLPLLWGSRLLAACAGALLVVPVAFLARRWFGERAGVGAALFTAASPGLLTFLPFFPRERWNLYFGSEPLFLLLGVSAIAAAVQAVEKGELRWWIALGALVAAAYLARLEGAVLALALAGSTLVALAVRRRPALLSRAVMAAGVAAAASAPYVLYLHATLGRWAVSGRVQAAAAVEEAPTAAGAPRGEGGSEAVRAFVWGGDREALWRALYRLDASGTRMASQYWGVPRASARMLTGEGEGGSPQRALSGRSKASPPRLSPSATASPPRPSPSAPASSPRPRPSLESTAGRGLRTVLPWWFLALALPGLAWARPRRDAVLWLAPALVTAIVPAALAYVEPRALLMLVPAACVVAAGTVGALVARFERRAIAAAAIAAVTLGLLAPTGYDLARAWSQGTPLQQVASARRAVGEYLGAHLPPEAVVVSWHPAVGFFAQREWRVLPYDSFDRILGYARAQQASAVVFSRFEPSPLHEPPRAFTVVLIDSTSTASGDNLRVDRVDETPLLFVGRLVPVAP